MGFSLSKFIDGLRTTFGGEAAKLSGPEVYEAARNGDVATVMPYFGTNFAQEGLLNSNARLVVVAAEAKQYDMVEALLKEHAENSCFPSSTDFGPPYQQFDRLCLSDPVLAGLKTKYDAIAKTHFDAWFLEEFGQRQPSIVTALEAKA
jgi:hypothetical protein